MPDELERYVSRVFVAGDAILEALTTQAQFPPHELTGEVPDVVFGDIHPDKGAERVAIVVGQPDNPDASNEWARIGPSGRDESMRFLIVARSWVPNMPDTLAVWRRLGELSGAIEDCVYDRRTRGPILLGFPGEVGVHRVSGVVPSIGPTPEGPTGGVVVTVDLLANI